MTDIILNNVRISFPHLFRKPVIRGQEGKYGGALMLHPEEHKGELITLKSAIQILIEDKLDGLKLPSERICLRKGEDKGRPEYEGWWVVSANNKDRPVVMDQKKNALTEDDNVIYSGCRVNALVNLWAQDNQYGKRINCNLIGIQYAGNDEPLDGNHRDAQSVIDVFGEVNSGNDEDYDIFATG